MPHLLAGDPNVHNSVWDAQKEDDAGGEDLLDWTLDSGHAVWNNPDNPDITMAHDLQIAGWRILSDAIASDHVILTYDISWADDIQPLLSDPPKQARPHGPSPKPTGRPSPPTSTWRCYPSDNRLSATLTGAILRLQRRKSPKDAPTTSPADGQNGTQTGGARGQ